MPVPSSLTSTVTRCGAIVLNCSVPRLLANALAQAVQHRVCKPGHDRAAGPGQGCAKSRKRPGPKRQRKRLWCDPDDLLLRADGRYLDWLDRRRSAPTGEQEGSSGTNGDAMLTIMAECTVHRCFSISEIECAARTDLQARTTATAALGIDKNQINSPPFPPDQRIARLLLAATTIQQFRYSHACSAKHRDCLHPDSPFITGPPVAPGYATRFRP